MVEAVSLSERKSDRKMIFPHAVRKGSASVTIYRFVNAKRGEVFEVTWFKEGARKRKSFRDSAKALKHAEDHGQSPRQRKGRFARFERH
jgi:hypothetical protein